MAGCGKTTYAPGFTDEKFGKITVGMTEEQVKALVGEPLFTVRKEDRLYRVRVASGDLVDQVISYNERGNVSDAEGYVAKQRMIIPGISRSQAEGILHTTESKLLGTRWRWEYATNTVLADPHRTRAVEFGCDAKVKEVLSYDIEG